MKATGIVRRVDDLGRVSVPVELRRVLRIRHGDPVEIFVEGDRVILKKYITEKSCKLCGSDKRVTEVSDILVCQSCITNLAENYLEN